MSDTPTYREYIITCKSYEDLDNLYDDLETPGGSITIPDRPIECVQKRPISRNTHYYLTHEEAEIIRNDSRVLGVELTNKERGFKITPHHIVESSATEEEIELIENNPDYVITTTTWSKSTNNSDAHRPWALYRCVNGDTVTNWGSNGTQSRSGTVLFTSTGKNVDVVVVDGHLDPAHPEFAVNENGTGGSRVNQFDWFSLNLGPPSPYFYTNPYVGTSRNYTVTAPNSTNYSFSGSSSGNDPTLNVTAGDTLTFNLSVAGHPFWIKTAASTGTGSGVTTGTITGTNGSTSGTLVWDTTGVTPGTYYYICQIHSSMQGTINVAAAPAGSYINGSADQQSNNNHGCHVAGTMAGNRRGWARDANIYNISPYASAPSADTEYITILYDLIREWHNTKAPNPITGFKNPTITNHSYGINYDVAIANVTSVNYRGTTTNNPTAAQCTTFGLVNDGTTIQDIPLLSTADAADILDMINDGIIFIASAGNSSFKMDIPGGLDYNNTITSTTYGTEYYHRGSSPGSLPGVICVGSVDATVTEQKAIYSNCGPRVDIYAPGSNVISSVHSNEAGLADSRNSAYENMKYNGTSMASPNVAGVVACIAEQWPRITQTEVLDAISAFQLTKTNQLTSGTSTRSLQDSPNRYLQYPMIRKVPNPAGATYIGGQTTSQITFPRNNNKFRPIKDGAINQTSGLVYPRHPIWNRRGV
jgi:plastocyanin